MTQSDGSITYRRVSPRDAIIVFYDARHPDKPRLDLFLELWLTPILLALVTGVLVLGMLFVISKL